MKSIRFRADLMAISQMLAALNMTSLLGILDRRSYRFAQTFRRIQRPQQNMRIEQDPAFINVKRRRGL